MVVSKPFQFQLKECVGCETKDLIDVPYFLGNISRVHIFFKSSDKKHFYISHPSSRTVGISSNRVQLFRCTCNCLAPNLRWGRWILFSYLQFLESFLRFDGTNITASSGSPHSLHYSLFFFYLLVFIFCFLLLLFGIVYFSRSRFGISDSVM